MIMPFVRLIAIYIVVGLAIFAFFKRDAVIALINGPEETHAEVIADVSQDDEPAPMTDPEPASDMPVLTQPVAATAEPVFAPADPTSAPVSINTMEDRWAAARQAFWDGNGDESLKMYTALASDFPNEAGIAGELGNLYYNAGRTADAARQYHTVGLIAVATGNDAEAKAMIGILQVLSPDLANDLKARAEQNN